MKHTICIILLVVASLGIDGAAWAQSAAELLEKGIYTEETVGDLEAAIKIYDQIVSNAEADRPSIAQALYRLGMCYVKSGREEKAKEAFEKLIKEFPDQTDLVAKARANLPGAPQEIVLEPVPWVDGEVLQLTLKLPAGLRIGKFILTVDSTTVGGKDAWRFQFLRYVASGGNNQGISRIHAGKDDLTPLRSMIKHSMLGHFEAVFEPNRVQVTPKGTDKNTVREIELDQTTYDNDQSIHLMRRLPLEVGYKTSIPVIAIFGGQLIDVGLEVTAKEMVTVPAGTFECYKAELSIHQTLWFSTDSNRYVVKFEGGGVVGELSEIAVRKSNEPIFYEDKAFGFSLTAPAGWFFHNHDTQDMTNVRVVQLLDPEMAVIGRMEVKKPPQGEEMWSPRSKAEERISKAKKVFKEYAHHEDSWSDRKVSGQQAVSFTADYKQGDQSMIQYRILVAGKKMGTEFIFSAPAGQFEDYRGTFDVIAESYKVE